MSYRNDLKKLCKEMNFEFQGAKGRRLHFTLICKETGKKTFAPATPRNPWRTLKNTKSNMRRIRQ